MVLTPNSFAFELVCTNCLGMKKYMCLPCQQQNDTGTRLFFKFIFNMSEISFKKACFVELAESVMTFDDIHREVVQN